MSFLLPYKMRPLILNMGGYKISTSAHIKSRCYFEGNNVYIGENVFVNHDCKFYSHNGSLIAIEDNVTIAMGVTFCTHTHKIGNRECRARKGTVVAPITIGIGTWIGANVTVLPGVTIGSGCIIAAGSVVTQDCVNNGLYAGVPAILKKIME